MSAETQLGAALDQWHRLAREESEAIQAHNWNGLAACQEALSELQPRITCWLQKTRAEWTGLGLEATVREDALKARVSELLEMEKQNNALLQDARRTVQARLGQSQQTTRTLHRLRSSYAPVPPAAWTSFS
ncbi:MAG TPA: hypothetical protein VNT26_17085 [Candidatus Sulfotelmatobacter sp.]|nr:hypothetical protein [Candidatus Sulfotelmatobacter sp.]HWI58350.1 hypothetical protein [Bacillota bacterium]